MSEERMRILEMVAEGTITSEQAAQLIQALDESADDEVYMEDAEADIEPMVVEADYVDDGPEPAYEAFEPDEPYEVPEMPKSVRRFRSFWYIPLAIGVFITSVSGLLVYAGNQASWHWFWMVCVWMPLLLGIVITMIAAMSRTARWVHVRVKTGQDEWPRNIRISLPLPLRTAAFTVKFFGRFIPGLDEVPIPIDEAIYAVKDSLTPDDPLYIHVDNPGGEKVEVYIG
jgi:hypothetical protein